MARMISTADEIAYYRERVEVSKQSVRNDPDNSPMIVEERRWRHFCNVQILRMMALEEPEDVGADLPSPAPDATRSAVLKPIRRDDER